MKKTTLVSGLLLSVILISWFRHFEIRRGQPVDFADSMPSAEQPDRNLSLPFHYVSAADVREREVSVKKEIQTRDEAVKSDRSLMVAPVEARAWHLAELEKYRSASIGDRITIPLLGGRMADGHVDAIQTQNGNVQVISGDVISPENGRFFFQATSRELSVGSLVGFVRFAAGEASYRVEVQADGTLAMVEVPLDKLVCVNYTQPPEETMQEIPPLNPSSAPGYPVPAYQDGIISLQSLPGAAGVLYMDFRGGTLTGNEGWGTFSYERPNVDKNAIKDVWKRVAEDFLPLTINVTTDIKVYQAALPSRRIRCILTPTSTAAPGAGGVAYLGSWGGAGNSVCWSFYSSGKSAAEVVSHEVGHTLNLSHDGRTTPAEGYFGGHGSGVTGWAPIMGVGYYQPVAQWSKGEYANANQTQDDLAILTGFPGAGYRVDDTGNSLVNSRYLEAYPGDTVFAEGVIERTADTDAFQFTTTGGVVTFNCNPVNGDWANLAIAATLADAANTMILSNSPQNQLTVSLSTNLPAGTYTVRVTGAGRNNPSTSGFSSYASLGYYSITGTVAGIRLPTRFTLNEGSSNGTVVGSVTANGAGTLAYAVTGGNTGGAFAINNNGMLTVANSGVLNYETLAANTQYKVQYELFVNITNLSNPSLTELSRRVVVQILDVNEPPTLTGLFTNVVVEHIPPGTVLGTVSGTDPDFGQFPLFSIVTGNSGGMFGMDSHTGKLTVVGDLNASIQTIYDLTVVAIDNPLNGVANSITGAVRIVVVPNTSVVWTGGGANNNWNMPANWSSALPNVGGSVAFGASVRQANVNNTVSLLNSVQFTNGGFAISGSSVQLQYGLTNIGNNSWGLETTLGLNQSWHIGSGTLTASGKITGVGGLTKSGPGQLFFNNTGNNYTGPTRVTEGALTFSAQNSFASSVTMGAGTTLNLDGFGWTLPAGAVIGLSNATLRSTVNGNDRIYVAGPIVVQSNATIFTDNTTIYQLRVRGGLFGTDAHLTIRGNGTGGQAQFYGNNGGLSGTVIVTNTGINIWGNSEYLFANVDLTFRGAGANLGLGNDDVSGTGGNNNIHLRSLNGDAGTFVYSDNRQCILTLGESNGSGTFAGAINNGAGAGPLVTIIKVGTGNQVFTGANTYTGDTTVSNGTLTVNGSLAAGSAVTLTGGALAGTGTINGPVTVQAGGSVMPGTGGIGTLNVNNTLNNSGTLEMQIAKNGGVLTRDRIQGVTTFNVGGSLAVTHLGPTALAAGDSFSLLGASSYVGSFISVALPVLDPGLAWNTANLTINGTISVVNIVGGGTPGTPTGLALNTLSANKLRLTWNASGGATSYLVKREGVEVAVVAGTTFVDNGLTPGSTFCYTVAAISTGGISADSGSVCGDTAPSGALLTWDANLGAGGPQDGNGIWDGVQNQFWNGTLNLPWFDNNYGAFGAGAGGSYTVTLNANVAPAGLTFNAIGGGGYTIDGAGSILTANSPTIQTVGNATLGVAITGGNEPVTKTGMGTLALTTNTSTFAGPMNIQQGRVRATTSQGTPTPASTALGSVTTFGRTVTVASGATLALEANDVLGNGAASPLLGFNISGTVTNAGNQFNTLGPINLNGGRLANGGGANASFQAYSLLGGVAVVGSTPSFITGSGANNGIHLGSKDVGSQDNNSSTFDVADVTSNANVDLSVSVPLLERNASQGTGQTRVRKSGLGKMVLSAANSFSGGLTLSAGTVQLAHSSAAGAGPVAIGNFLTGTQPVELEIASATIGNSITVFSDAQGPVTIRGIGGLAIVNGPLTLNREVTLAGGTSDRFTFTGVISGSGGLTIVGGGSNPRVTLDAANTFNGDVSINSGAILQFNNAASVPSGSDITNHGTIKIAGVSPTFGGLFGTGTVGNHEAVGGNTTITIGGGNRSGGFSGVIQNVNGTVALTKTGTGTQALNGANTYTGATIINAGVLQVNGSTAAGSAVMVNNGGMLAGRGTVNGTVTVQSGGTIDPGTDGIGQLQIIPALTLSAGRTLKVGVGKSGAVLTNGVLRVANTFNPGGTLVVTNVGPDALVAGNSFRILNVNVFGVSNFAATNLPPLNPGLAWNLGALKTTGTISVEEAEPVTPPALSLTVSEATLTLSWPQSYTSYLLQVQTNAPGAGLGTNWVNLTVGVANNQYSASINQTVGSVFYRLFKP